MPDPTFTLEDLQKLVEHFQEEYGSPPDPMTWIFRKGWVPDGQVYVIDQHRSSLTLGYTKQHPPSGPRFLILAKNELTLEQQMAAVSKFLQQEASNDSR